MQSATRPGQWASIGQSVTWQGRPQHVKVLSQGVKGPRAWFFHSPVKVPFLCCVLLHKILQFTISFDNLNIHIVGKMSLKLVKSSLTNL